MAEEGKDVVKSDFRHGDLTGKIIGLFYEVYNTLGYGFLESVYENALAHKLRQAGMAVTQQAPLRVHYEGIIVGEFFADIIVDNIVILELKTVERLDPAHHSQLHNYLRATECEIGLLLNFGPAAEVKRIILDNSRKPYQRFPRRASSSG